MLKRLPFLIPVLLSILVMIGVVPINRVKSKPSMRSVAIPRAKAWIKLVDAGKYGPSWDQAASYFKGAMTRPAWIKALQSYRKPLGKNLSRTWTQGRARTSLPGAPDGHYRVFSLKSSFARKKTAVETLTMMQDKDGQWRAAGYFIR